MSNIKRISINLLGNNKYIYIFLKEVFILINKVEIANTNTSKLKVLTNKENKELFLRLRAGDLSAREELINGNLRLVLSIIQRFGGRRRECR